MSETKPVFPKYVVLYPEGESFFTDDYTEALIEKRDNKGVVYIRGDVAAEG